jgi:hypothetical protein
MPVQISKIFLSFFEANTDKLANVVSMPSLEILSAICFLNKKSMSAATLHIHHHHHVHTNGA